ncbi:MAG: nuclear transport factor 2 family protein [Alphaproteobacteria bacterium]
MADTLQVLKDKAEIQETILKYATGLDSRDFALYRSIFADEVDIDFSSYSGQPASRMTGDEWGQMVQRMLPGFDATQHVLTNFVIEVDGDEATANVYVQAEHFIANSEGDNSHTLGGYYIHKLKRHGDAWKIHATTLNVTWNRGNRDVYRLATERVAAREV